MTSQEQQMLQGLTTRVNQTVLQDKDPEAEQFIGQSLGRNPDALYILAQTVLVQQYALDQAKKQLDELRQQAQNPPAQPQKHTSFLGNLLGLNDEPTHPVPPPPQQAPYGQPQYASVPNYGPGSGQPQYGQPQYGQPQYGQPQASGQGSFLRSAMQTATGVAAGALAFQGIESLMHGFGGHSGSGLGDFGGGGGRDEVVNNYYGDSAAGRGVSGDIEDRRNDAGSDTSLADNDPDDFADTSSDTGVDTSLADNDPDDFGSSDDSNS